MEKKKGLFSWYFDFNLLYRILIGLVLGAIFGMILAGALSGATLTKVYVWTDFFGNVFVRLLNMIMLPIIISTLIVGASSVSPAQLGKVGIRVIIFYLVTSAVAVVIGLLMGSIFGPRAELAGLTEEVVRAADKTSIATILLNIIPTNIFASIVNVQVLPIIFFALVFGLALSYLRIVSDQRIKNAAEIVYNFFDGIAEAIMKVIKGIMQYAPIGVACLVFGVFAKNGPKVAGALGVVTAACFIGYAIHVVVIYFGLLRFYGGMSIKRFIRDGKDPFITAFVTRSSNGTLPVTMESAENMGIKKDVYSFSLPLGATINMDGTAIYQGVCAIFIALTVWGHSFTIGQMGLIVVTATLASIGTAGVPGAGAIMLLMVLETVGLPVTAGSQVALAYAMILGIDAILDMGRTALNVTGDLVCTTIVSKKMGELDMNKWNS
ncbi:MAG: dicarboxylate/amino acid:cation symporter [Treponema sp.]|jgi:Na+/H+-dicarboxylate symporter|nr:dicarboxylate/amino acid:cation symporter [Treponema sp.]